ncbi:peptide chain release factor N(5)-glutamine methyltransferase [Pseudidiomarina halophila]|uniref:Release factor glutamine methyltransferase n=1 Tax=Pseudidiomarina halophila TaxID=1449799 RepID=A0A432XZL1_9GAMM|nr:peptide chain release factor N(5)-glutamine methyltransferase [Pseudidiomarina halophila]RUO54166.1 peptide chain release factor N(5)-glutamine methyltransferase [Pseudidiomarina halophila]
MTASLPAQSLRAAIEWAQGQLNSSASARLDAEVLLAHVLNKSRTYLHTWPERELDAQQQKQYANLVAARASGKPVAHLTGTREFWSLELLVNDSTLIPRPDTEILVARVLQLDLPQQAQVLDLGTGTGAIALALKSERPGWSLVALDQSPAAVALAQRNAARLELDLKVMQSHWFSALQSAETGGFDAIVANPPYIAADDPHLQQGDVRFEPHSALVAEQEGLADLMHIIAQARSFLNDGGWLVLEHGWQQAAACRDYLTAAGYTAVASGRDYANLERISYGQWRHTGGKTRSAVNHVE